MVGGEVIQIAIGFHQLQVNLTENIGIYIETDFAHEQSGRPLSDATDLPTRSTTLISLLGKVVERVEAEAESALIIHFSGGETLKIFPDDAPYESFQVTGPQGLIVV